MQIRTRMVDNIVSFRLPLVMTYRSALAALADPTRQKIIQLLRDGPKPVGAISRQLPVSRPAVSQHLKVLTNAGLLSVIQQGTRRFYQLSPVGIDALRGFLDALWSDALATFEAYANNIKDAMEMIDPVVKKLEILLPPDRVFRLFTEDFAAWWPVETHSLSADQGSVPQSVTVEGRVDGKVSELLHDGTSGLWGTITKWQPGAVFEMSWHVGRPAAEATRLHVAFTPTAQGTQVTLTHDGWENRGAAAAEAREGYNSGWDIVLLRRFSDHCSGTIMPGTAR